MRLPCAPRIAVATLLLGGLAGACAVTFDPPDLGEQYDRVARYHGPERNPIVVIPGLTGSNLVDGASGRVVWGAFTGDYARPARAEDLRLIALPMNEGTSLGQLRDEVRPDGVLDRVRVKVLGIPLVVRAYVQILAMLGAAGYRDESLGLAGAVDYGSDHYTCFQFDYDWRRDNVESAFRLARFLDEKRAYVRQEGRRRFGTDPGEARFDVVAHSMGALVVRYFLRFGDADLPADGSLPPVTWAGAGAVERVVLVGPPNAGSLAALVELVEGHRPGPMLPRYPPALLGTFPSISSTAPPASSATILPGTDGESSPAALRCWQGRIGAAKRAPERQDVDHGATAVMEVVDPMLRPPEQQPSNAGMPGASIEWADVGELGQEVQTLVEFVEEQIRSSAAMGLPPLIDCLELFFGLWDDRKLASHFRARSSATASLAGRERPSIMDFQPASSAASRAMRSSSVISSAGSARQSSNSVPSGSPVGAVPMILPFSTRTLSVSMSMSIHGSDDLRVVPEVYPRLGLLVDLVAATSRAASDRGMCASGSTATSTARPRSAAWRSSRPTPATWGSAGSGLPLCGESWLAHCHQCGKPGRRRPRSARPWWPPTPAT